MESLGIQIPAPAPVKVYFAPMGARAKAFCFGMVNALRQKGVSAETDHMSRSFKAQFKYADKIGAQYVVAVGDDELDSGSVAVRNMADGSSVTVQISALTDALTSL